MKLKMKLAAVVMLLGTIFAGSAYAVTPANTVLQNTAKLTYTGNATGVTASVDVTVQLVSAQPAFSGAAIVSPVTKAENQPYTTTFKVKAQGNGPETYNLTAATTNVTNLTGVGTPVISANAPHSGTSIVLGATAIDTTTTASTTISVPSDEAATPGTPSVNGIKAGDTVDINGTEYTVASVVDGGPGNPSSITLTAAVPASLPPGTGVFEVAEITATLPSVGAITTPGAANLDLELEVASTQPGATAFKPIIDINVVKVSFDKYVRNASTDSTAGPGDNCNTGSNTGATIVTYNSETYCASGAVAAPGEILEYYIKVEAATGAPLAAAIVTDVLDEFTTYVTNSTRLNNITVILNDSGVFPLSLTGGADGLSIDENGGRTAATEGTGTLAAAGIANVVYRATVNN